MAKYPDIIFQGEQGHLNYMLQKAEQEGRVVISRKKIMIWPDAGQADFIDFNRIKERDKNFPLIIHWAGMKFKTLKEYPRSDLMFFFRDYYYSKSNIVHKKCDLFFQRFYRLRKD